MLSMIFSRDSLTLPWAMAFLTTCSIIVGFLSACAFLVMPIAAGLQ